MREGLSRTPAPGRRVRAPGSAAYLSPLVIALALLPLGKLIFDAATGGLGVEPVETLVRRTGWWALTLLVATLAITPLRRITGRNELIRVRKPLGVLAFAYATLHLLAYVVIDQWLALEYVVQDILERPFITAGFIAFVLLTPLAATSTKGAVRRLGGRRWQRLHRLVYPAALLSVLHYYWLVKADTTPPLIFAGIVLLLLALRVVLRARKPGGQAKRDSGASIIALPPDVPRS